MNADRIRDVVADMRVKSMLLRHLVVSFSKVAPKHAEAFAAIANKQDKWATEIEEALDGKTI